MREGLLCGFRVVDLSQDIAGPYCTKLMAGLGADVIKVEPPEGDPSRRAGPFPDDIPHPEKSALYLYLNTGKLGVTLNLECTDGQRLLHELLKDADVIVESYPPDRAHALGISYSFLQERCPQLVVTSITPFGQTGPYRSYRAHEINLYGAGGLMYITGDPDREPLKMGPPLSQYGAGQNALIATLCALWQRESTGEGQHADISIAEYNLSILENAIAAYTYTGHIVSRMGNRGYGRAAHGIYLCRDGHIGVVAMPDHRWLAMSEIMEREELRDSRFQTRAGRLENADEIDALMLPWLVEHDKEDIFKRGQEAGLGFALVHTFEDLLRCEQLVDRDFFTPVEHPEAGRLQYPGAPFKIDDAEWRTAPAPLLGEHNEAVYCGRLGYARQDLVRLRQMEAI
ncbi:MAG: CoA transferase [Chloroflexi bacterium]|nr:CoA transferase [Chloroflexota bacterium]